MEVVSLISGETKKKKIEYSLPFRKRFIRLLPFLKHEVTNTSLIKYPGSDEQDSGT